MRGIQNGDGMDAMGGGEENGKVATSVGADAQGVTVGSTRPLTTSYDCKKYYSFFLLRKYLVEFPFWKCECFVLFFFGFLACREAVGILKQLRAGLGARQ
jgi:hypothetical protein